MHHTVTVGDRQWVALPLVVVRRGAAGKADAQPLASLISIGSTGAAQVYEEYERICQLASLDDTACEVAEARHNARLNRYFNVLPFDYNRVQLSVMLSAPRPAAQLRCHHSGAGGCRISWPCEAAIGMRACQIPGRCQIHGSLGWQTRVVPRLRLSYNEIYLLR